MTLMLNRSTWRQPAALGFSSVPCMCAPQRTFKVRKDTVTNKENWVSLPLCELRKLYTTEVQKKNSGRASGRKAARHPASAGLPCGNMSCIHTHIHTSCMGQPASCQDKTNPEMRVYTVFRDIKDTSPLAADTYVKLIETPASQCPLPENCPKSTNSNHPKP